MDGHGDDGALIGGATGTLESTPVSAASQTGESAGTQPLIELRLSTLAWAAAIALFLLLRIGPIFQAPVGGAELVHLSGAWQARLGAPDDRFVPTLFQSLTTLLLHLSSSEVPARVLAFVATASIPVAVYLLRPRLGEAGALLALAILALDGPGINIGVSASAMGFDIALTVWLAVAIARMDGPPPIVFAPLAAFLVVTAGPLPLPLLAGWLTVGLARGERPGNATMLLAAAGAVLGILAASVRFGLGADGLRVPPFDLFAASFDQRWSTSTAAEVMVLYGGPVLTAGLAIAVAHVSRAWRDREIDRFRLFLIAWSAFSLAWFLAAATSHSAISVVALTTPLAFIVGPALAMGLGAMWRADWRLARFLIPLGIFALSLALFIVLDWTRASAVGNANQKVLVALLLLAAAIAAVIVGYNRRSAPALVAAALGLALLPIVSGAMGVALSAGEAPIPSPVSPAQARELRDLALQHVATKGGSIVVHPSFADAATWPFRDSGNIVVASRVPQEATVVLWPSSEPPPEGFTALDGNWALTREILPPTQDFLAYLHWFTDRNILDVTSDGLSVYLRAKD
jgi:hypothetical protein